MGAIGLSFGPSKRYLATNKLVVGDTLEFNILDFARDEIDTEYGSKFSFEILILKSSSSEIKPGEATWNTICNAARELHAYFIEEKVILEGPKGINRWIMQLKVEETGFRLDVIG
jgi:hypothetical protein